MFLLNSCLSLFSAACISRHPFSRSYGVILPSSLTMLLPPALGFSPHPPVSVYGTGTVQTIAAFLGTHSSHFGTILPYDSPPQVAWRFFQPYPYLAYPALSIRGSALCMRPHISVILRYGNLNPLSIGYAFRPLLRSRLTRGRSALPRKPWIFGRKDSHLALATHSGILSSNPSTAPFGTASSVFRMLLYHSYISMNPRLRCRVLAPDIFGAGPLD